MRVNVGCGDKYFPGWTNCDRHGEADVSTDAFPLPFPTDAATELWAIHLLEHLHRRYASEALTEWFRVLKPGGRLVLELPCMDKIARMIVDGEKDLRLTVMGIFGDPREENHDMMHQWCWSERELLEALTSVGYEQITFTTPIFHIPKRDMRVEARKPPLTIVQEAPCLTF
jgi:predicted SAM-dependent methyltransferase